MSTTKGRNFQLAAALLSLLVVSFLVFRTSNAAFTDTTDNPGNSWAAGSVVLEDDDGGSTAMFTATNMVPGDVITNCITVDYTGSSFDLTPVTLYGSSTDGAPIGLADHLDVTITEGTAVSPGGFGNCTSFAAGSVLATDVALSSLPSGYGTGYTGYTPSSGDEDRVYKIDVTLGTDTPDTAQNGDATATFTWEVRSDDTTP